MFKSHLKSRPPAVTADYSGSFKSPTSFKVSKGAMDDLGLQGDITALGVDPVGGWWALGLSTGSVHMFGSAPVHLHLSVHPPSHKTSLISTSSAIKHLVFHSGRKRLVVVDAKSTVHVWKLDVMKQGGGGVWKEGTNSLYGTVTGVDISPSTSHMVLSMKDGSTAFLDLERNAHLAPTRIPNVWARQEDRLRRSGMDVPSRGRPPMALAVQISPRDIDKVLVAYEGGVVLWSIEKQASLASYNLMLPPGAPGGGSYMDEDLFTERNPGVTCITWHPSALSFAVGYEDGCIAVWAVEDSDKPLSVRTVEKADVNVTDAESLFDSGALDRDPDAPSSSRSPRREPIFKLSWASFPDATAVGVLEAGGEVVSEETKAFASREETCLIVLGGLLPTSPQGLNVLQFPAYRPPSISVAPPTGSYGLSSAVRAAFRDSLTTTGSFLYRALPGAQVEDFLLVPRSSPYLSGGSDPIAIFILESSSTSLPPVTGPQSSRELRALTLPHVRTTLGADGERKEYATGGEDYVPMTAPPQMVSNPSTPVTPSTGWFSPVSPSLGSAPEQPPSIPPLVSQEGFGEYRLPGQLWAGSSLMLGCRMVDVGRESFDKVRRWDAGNVDGWDGMPRLPLDGGRARPTLTGSHAPNLRALKVERNRLLVSWHRDGTARFFDISPQLLVLPDPLLTEFPSPIPALSILLQPLLAHPSLGALPIARLLRSDPSRFEIKEVQFAADANEVAIVLASGEVVYFRWSEAREDLEIESRMEGLGLADVKAGQVVDLRHLSDWTVDGFKPICLVDVRRGPVAACAVSDAGFLAISYLQNSLCLVDLRGPEIILREGFGEEGDRRGSVSTVARTLQFTVSGLGSDPTPQVRLLAVYDSGATKVFTVAEGLAGWTVEKKVASVTHDSLVRPFASFVLEGKKGEIVSTNRHALDRIGQTIVYPPEIHCAWIAVAARSIRVHANITGDRLAKVELLEDVTSAAMIQREGQSALVVTLASGVGQVYALPSLELAFESSIGPPGGAYTFSSSSSDFVHYHSPASISIGSLLDIAQPLPPTFEFDTPPKRALGAQPLPVQFNVLASWLGSWGGGVLTGAQVDTLLAGPKRPAANPRPAQPSGWGGSIEGPSVQSDVAKAAVAKANATRSARGSVSASASAREEVESPGPQGKSIFQQMTDAAAERGNILDGLSDRMNDVGRQAGEWQKQAKQVAMEESAKASAKGFFGKYLP